ncbi:hypothetical protein [uncultured Hymenobacter sp.]|uniref:hypothetical protein n=1 Tax=uncultured Hymenobacter sp. TaxID=170016 RepID=UPI0035CC0022
MMTSDQLQENIEDSLHRLRAAYDVCMSGYNRAMFKELSHSLRYWADMKGEAGHYIAENKPTTKFWSSRLARTISRSIKNNEYVIVNYPKALIATIPYRLAPQKPQGQPKYDQELLLVPVFTYQGKEICNSCYATKIGALLYALKHVVVIYDTTPETPVPRDPYAIETMYFTAYEAKFAIWLTQEVVRVNKINASGKLILHSITRERLIRRLANKWGGSHPQGAIEIDDESDEAIERLMEFRVAERPLALTILLKIAQDILDGFDYLEGSQGANFVFSKFVFPPEKSLTPLPAPGPAKQGPYSKITPAVLHWFICKNCGVQRLIQFNLIKGTPLQVFAGAEMYPANDILACLGCGIEMNIRSQREKLEALQGARIYTE